jgi:hypothetical protein
VRPIQSNLRFFLLTKNSDDDRVEPSSSPAPVRKNNVSDDDSVGQLRAIERVAAIVTKNSDDDRVNRTPAKAAYMRPEKGSFF